MVGLKRNLFPSLEFLKYFNACSITPLATPVEKAVHEYLEVWKEKGGIAWVMEGGWTDKVEEARSLFASLIGANPEHVAYSFGNSVATASIISALNLSKSDHVIFNDLDFPSSPAHMMALEEKQIKHKILQSSNHQIQVDQYTKQINEINKDGNKVGLIAACEVVSNTGFRLNMTELLETAHSKDIPVFADTYQSTGYIPHSVDKSGVDFLATGCLKWLLGGFGISFLYVREDHINNLNPSSIGWMGTEDPFQDLFDKLRPKLHRPGNARKFQYGTPYPIGAVTAIEGMKIIKEIGIEKIHATNMKLTKKIIDMAHEYNLQVQTPVIEENRGSIVNVKLDNATEKVNQLQSENFVLDMRANGVRIAPHFYNTFQDIEILFERLDELNTSS